MYTFLRNRSPKSLHEQTKRLPEPTNYQNGNRYPTTLKRPKIEICEEVYGNSKASGNQNGNRYPTNLKRPKIEICEEVYSNSKANSNLVIHSGFKGLNDSTLEHGNAKDLWRQSCRNNGIKVIENEANSSALAARSTSLCHGKSGTSSPLVPHTRSQSISEHRRGVSVSWKMEHGLDLPVAKSDVLLDATTKISQRYALGSSGIKMEKNESTDIAAWERKKLKQVNRDETCKAAEMKTSPEYQWKSAVRENKRRSERILSSTVSTIEARLIGKNQGKTDPEPIKGEQKIKKFASMTESGVPSDVAHFRQPNAILVPEHLQQVSRLKERQKVKNVLEEFDKEFAPLREKWDSIPKEKRKGNFRGDLKVAKKLREIRKWINYDPPCVGHVPGVEVGDRFCYRAQLSIIGLHRQYRRGINCEIDGMKRKCATSVVDSTRYYENRIINENKFKYIGEGGNPDVSKIERKDQELTGGNLGMMNSRRWKIPVRVIRGNISQGSIMFEYCGLYEVTDYDYGPAPGSDTFKVYQFTMTKIQNLTDLPTTEKPTTQLKQPVIHDHDGTSNPVNRNKTSKFPYNSPSQRYGGSKSSSYSGLWNADENFDYEAAAAMAKPIGSNRHRPHAIHTYSKLKLG